MEQTLVRADLGDPKIEELSAQIGQKTHIEQSNLPLIHIQHIQQSELLGTYKQLAQYLQID